MSASSIKNRHRRRRQDRPRPAPARAGRERRLPARRHRQPQRQRRRRAGLSNHRGNARSGRRSSMPCRCACRRNTDTAPPTLRLKPASMCSWRSRQAPPSARSKTLRRWLPRKASRCLRAGIRATRPLSRRRGPFWRRPGQSAVPSTGKRTSAAGTPIRNGSGRPAGSACSIPASMPCRSPRTSCRRLCSSPRQRLSFPKIATPRSRPQIEFSDADGLAVKADFDWRQTGPQSWDIVAETDAGRDGPVGWRRQARGRRPHRP